MIGRLILLGIVAALIAAFLSPMFKARSGRLRQDDDDNDKVRYLDDKRRDDR